MTFDRAIHAKAIALTKSSIEMTSHAGSGHPTSAASLAHLVTVLLYDHMRFEPENPRKPGSDHLVLSEGHACPIVYAAAADLGMAIRDDANRKRRMTCEDLDTLRAIDSPVDGHPNPGEGFPFFPAATGSLGQGLSVAAGMALAARHEAWPTCIYTLIGDGESREGQIWEALDMMVDLGLSAVCPIFNANGQGQSAPVSPQQSAARLTAKLEAFGLSVARIDGHDPSAIRAALEEHRSRHDEGVTAPCAIVAETVKGFGFEGQAGHGRLHGKPLEGEEREEALRSLDERAKELSAAWDASHVRGPREVPRIEVSEKKPHGATPRFEETLRAKERTEEWEKGKMATRDGFGLGLWAIGHVHEDVFVIDGDVSDSTRTSSFEKDETLRKRFVEGRIAEQNMVSCAAGLAVLGQKPFVTTFSKFLMRACDQIEMAWLGRLPVRLVGSHSGVGPAADGPSQMGLSDVAFFRAFTGLRDEDGAPRLHLLQPADARAAYSLTVAMAEHEGACAMRTHRPSMPAIYGPETEFRLGGHARHGDGGDVLLVSAGAMLHTVLEARDTLAKEGIEATVLDLYSIPFDEDAVLAIVESCGGRVVTVEDNEVGGIGSELAEKLAHAGQPNLLETMFVRRFPKSGRSADDVLRSLGLAADDVVQRVRDLLERSSIHTS